MNVECVTDRPEAIAIETSDVAWDYDDHILGIFDGYVGCSGLKSLSVCAFCTSSSNTFVNTKSVRVHWLDTSSGLVTKVQRAFVGPLRSAFDTAIEA
jgi:hypothetical protein